MPLKYIPLIITLILLLVGCSQDELELKLQLDTSGGLQPGDAVVIQGRTVGRVTAVETAGQNSYVAMLELDNSQTGTVTQSARFFVDEDPDNPDRRRVEILPGNADDPPLADGDTVQGSVRQMPLFPLGEIFRGFAEGLGIFRDQVKRFESEMRRLPESEEMDKLRKEWARLLDELQSARAATEDSIKEDLLPKLQKEMQRLEDQLRSLEARPKKEPETI
ncbi:MlaD family protein [Methylocaldum szegediense]|uniref:MlaD family protein n=1 Tax=Methylocaldum szegediense TaxID=73780 RepID=UPI0004271292|nr:MlaD family protein [Methylocaldum szegediense]